MKSSIILQGATISLFICLITAFVGFKSGYFIPEHSAFPLSPNGSILQLKTDSLSIIDAAIARHREEEQKKMMHSSKVAIVIEKRSVTLEDIFSTKQDSIKTDLIARGLWDFKMDFPYFKSDSIIPLLKPVKHEY